MKSALFCCFLLAASSHFTRAQSSFYSCDSREVCYWNDTIQNFEDCTKNTENSRFKVNKDATVFEHTTPDLTSAYYVSKYEHDAVNDVEVYDATSDVGNKYTYIFDTKVSEIRIVGVSTEGETYMVTYHVKATWSE